MIVSSAGRTSLSLPRQPGTTHTTSLTTSVDVAVALLRHASKSLSAATRQRPFDQAIASETIKGKHQTGS